MHLGKLVSICFGGIAIAVAVLLVVPVKVASATSPVSEGTNFDIPLSDLSKVKKKAPTKRVAKESRKKKKKEAKLKKAPSETTARNETASQAKKPPVEETHLKSTAVLSDPEFPQIHHSPYSFVLAGKQTVIQAVINSKADILEVNCAFRGVEGGTQDLVKMVKVNGTRFTYTATLPGLPPESPALRYTIVTVDSSGKVARSQEFVTPVGTSPVVPSWQIDSTVEAAKGQTGK